VTDVKGPRAYLHAIGAGCCQLQQSKRAGTDEGRKFLARRGGAQAACQRFIRAKEDVGKNEHRWTRHRTGLIDLPATVHPFVNAPPR
jgi:hypothetical protein